MRRLGLIAAAGFGALVLAGCATMSVSSYVERSIDFAQYRTYSWGPADALPVGDPRLDNNALFRDYVQGAVERHLAARGYVHDGSGTPDLLIHYHANVQRRFNLGERPANCNVADCLPPVFAYQAGTLVLDMLDSRTNTLIWRGWAEDAMDGVIGNQDRLEEKVERAVTRMIARLPVATALPVSSR